MMRRFLERVGYGPLLVASFSPAFIAVAVIELFEPFPVHWLSPHVAHYEANLLRAFTFLLGGIVLGALFFVTVHAARAEMLVAPQSPRKLLFQHVSLVAAGEAVIVVGSMFSLRDRIDQSLGLATPFVAVGLVVTILGLIALMRYENLRIKQSSRSKSIYGTVHSEPERGVLFVYPVGSAEPIALEAWLADLQTGALMRIEVEELET